MKRSCNASNTSNLALRMCKTSKGAQRVRGKMQYLSVAMVQHKQWWATQALDLLLFCATLGKCVTDRTFKPEFS